MSQPLKQENVVNVTSDQVARAGMLGRVLLRRGGLLLQLLLWLSPLLLLALDASAQPTNAPPRSHATAAAATFCDKLCQASQRAALVGLYAAWGGRRWERSHGWNSSSDHCSWDGVVCCVDGNHVTEPMSLADGVVATSSA